MACKSIFYGFIVVLFILVVSASAQGSFIINSPTTVDVELIAYNGLTDSSLFKGTIAGGQQKIDTPYRGLALLIFPDGQNYPLIIGDDPFTLKINNPAKPPYFADSGENEFFYRLLSRGDPEDEQCTFALLMLQAKQLMETSYSIRTVKELTVKKKEFQKFVGDHFESLKHSDMVRRLIAQYFMMHEYVDYHIEGAPATDIRDRYQSAVIDGVKNWLETLKTHIPQHEILNYCVSLYYNRSMVALASVIIDNFQSTAYCPGVEKETFSFPGDLSLTGVDMSTDSKLDEVKGEKIVAFVSDDCPVSLVTTIIKERQSADRKKKKVIIVAPLQQLSQDLLAMNRMVSGGRMLFINDEKWRKENLAEKIKLPLFVTIEDGKVVKVAN